MTTGSPTIQTKRLISNNDPKANLSSKTIVGVAQMCATNDKAKNLQTVENLVKEAKKQNAQMLFLPECCDFVGQHREQTLELAEPLTGKNFGQYRELAKEHKIWLSLGGIHEAITCKDIQNTKKVFNSHVVLNSNGDIVNVYRKLHLFDVETPEVRFRESDIVAPGDHLIYPLQTPAGKLGLQICYDVRFAETSTLLRKLGADIITFPSAFAYGTGKYHWEVLLRARAIENQCFVIAAAQAGYHNPKRQSWGHAMIVNPWGEILTSMDGDEIGVKVATINLSKIEEVTSRMPVFQHRRHDIYSLTTASTLPESLNETEQYEDRPFGNVNICKDTIFFESPLCYAFTNLRCVVKGHVLVATKRIAPRLKDLKGDEISEIFVVACKIQVMLENIYSTSAATIAVQDGPDAGQTIPHVHFHILPRRSNDFPHNDQIYSKIEERCESPPRSLQERIDEAALYRSYFERKINQ